MRMFFAMGGALIFSLVTADGAAAQAYPNSGYEIVTPGRPLGQDRSYVNPTPNGGYEMRNARTALGPRPKLRQSDAQWRLRGCDARTAVWAKTRGYINPR